MNNVIFESKKGAWIKKAFMQVVGFNIPTLIFVVLAVFMPIFVLEFIGFSVLVAFFFNFREKQFRMFEDRIEYFYPYSKSKIETIYLKDIYQVRFEDEFGNFFHIWPEPLKFMDTAFIRDRIFVYVNEEVDCKRDKDGKIPFSVFGISNTEIVKVLTQFQDKGAEVLVSTKRTSILEEMNMENWNKA